MKSTKQKFIKNYRGILTAEAAYEDAIMREQRSKRFRDPQYSAGYNRMMQRQATNLQWNMTA
jgi:hypothetical protein